MRKIIFKMIQNLKSKLFIPQIKTQDHTSAQLRDD